MFYLMVALTQQVQFPGASATSGLQWSGNGTIKMTRICKELYGYQQVTIKSESSQGFHCFCAETQFHLINMEIPHDIVPKLAKGIVFYGSE